MIVGALLVALLAQALPAIVKKKGVVFSSKHKKQGEGWVPFNQHTLLWRDVEMQRRVGPVYNNITASGGAK